MCVCVCVCVCVCFIEELNMGQKVIKIMKANKTHTYIALATQGLISVS